VPGTRLVALLLLAQPLPKLYWYFPLLVPDAVMAILPSLPLEQDALVTELVKDIPHSENPAKLSPTLKGEKLLSPFLESVYGPEPNDAEILFLSQ